MPTSTKASISVLITLLIVACTKTVVSYMTLYDTSSGKRGSIALIASRTPWAVASALAPGSW